MVTGGICLEGEKGMGSREDRERVMSQLNIDGNQDKNMAPIVLYYCSDGDSRDPPPPGNLP